MTSPSASRRYVEELIELYLWLPGTPHRASRQDRRLAAALYQQAVPLLVVRAALLIATARRSLRSSHLMPLPPIRTLHYFLPVVEEVLHQPPDPGYVDYILAKLKPLAQTKASAAVASLAKQKSAFLRER